MNRERYKFLKAAWFNLGILVIFCLPFDSCSEESSDHIKTVFRKAPYHFHTNIDYFNDNYHTQHDQRHTVFIRRILNENFFKIEPSDAIDATKYSQPVVNSQKISQSVKVPSISYSKFGVPNLHTYYHNTENIREQIPVPPNVNNVPKKNILNLTRDSRFIETLSDKTSHMRKSSGEGYPFRDTNIDNMQSDMHFEGNVSNIRSHEKNNFTDTSNNFLSISSDAILSYHPSNDDDKNSGIIKDKTLFEINTEENKSSHIEKSLLNSIVQSSISSTLPEHSTKTNTLHTYHHIELSNQTDITENIVTSTIIPFKDEGANFSSDAPLLDTEIKRLSSGAVAGIVIAVLVSVTLLSSAVIYLLYRKYNGKCTSVVESKFNTDNCGYLDDSLRSSIYLNNHIELPKESSEEMSSLDNDSFLNSLETMTIQNYWADNSKNTKV